MSVITDLYLFCLCYLKFLEKHVHDSLMEFLNSHELLHTTQSGFRPKHSCETALTYMIDSWLKAINHDDTIGVVMVDFKKPLI